MKRTNKIVALFTVFFVFVTFLGSMPMALFYIVEGGGGGGTTPTWPKTWGESVLVDDSGTWSDDRYAAWSQIETEEHIVSLRVVVTEKNDYDRKSSLQISTFYTYKGERTHDWQQNWGVIDYMKIEVVKVGSYYQYMDASWTTSESSKGCSPRDFTGPGSSEWSSLARILVDAIIGVVIGAATTNVIAGMAAGIFADLILNSPNDPHASATNPIGIGSDTSGYYILTNFDPMAVKYYGDDFGPYNDGYQLAYDLSSHCELRHGWTSSIPSGGYQGLKFRAVVGVEALTASGMETIATPWIYVGMIT